MLVIRPNCRVQFTATDFEFVIQVLGKKTSRASLLALLSDLETQALILDDPELFHAILEKISCLNLSSHFYFYLLVRQVLLKAGIKDPQVAEYVAEILTAFMQAERAKTVFPGMTHPCEYFFEMVAALKSADSRTSFCIRAHIGDYSLFMSGIFPDRIKYRAEKRGFPDLSYYAALGRTQYRLASDHSLAPKYDLSRVLSYLSDNFEAARQALNDLGERLITLDGNQHLPILAKS
jgi:hypothetical protein